MKRKGTKERTTLVDDEDDELVVETRECRGGYLVQVVHAGRTGMGEVFSAEADAKAQHDLLVEEAGRRGWARPKAKPLTKRKRSKSKRRGRGRWDKPAPRATVANTQEALFGELMAIQVERIAAGEVRPRTAVTAAHIARLLHEDLRDPDKQVKKETT